MTLILSEITINGAPFSVSHGTVPWSTYTYFSESTASTVLYQTAQPPKAMFSACLDRTALALGSKSGHALGRSLGPSVVDG
jgi:hypothetical protein